MEVTVLANNDYKSIRPSIDELAVYCVKHIWNNSRYAEENLESLRVFNMPVETTFCTHNVIALIKKNECLSSLITNKGMNDDDAFWKAVNLFIRKSELNLYNHRRKTTSKDPLIFLENEIKGKSWKEAKFFISRLMPASFLLSDECVITDEKADHDFKRFVNVNSYGTYMDLEFIRKTSIFYDSNGQQIIKRLNQVCEDAIKSNLNNSEEKGIFQTFFQGKKINENSKIKVYRGTSNPHGVIRPGDFVTPDIDYARDYIRGPAGVVIESELLIEDCIVSKKPFDYDSIELIFYPKELEKDVIKRGGEHFKVTLDISFKEFYEYINTTSRPNRVAGGL